ncbi:hypothetical protein [Streptomyces sp. NBC_00474]|uniref:hypothetical protein n=1 Tax=Streptomyces sp. NBC_00474 TaxID=2975754 RepID=UPI002253F1BF|nr:hypothetical protein [Streptomyces sp. NBC_00474]MCX5055094.1 hypothetical protein [Streptomyces sp. NBC_00474]
MTRPRPATADQDVHRRLGRHLLDVVRAQDAAISTHRRVPRTLQEMLPGYERQPVLTLHRPVMADDACPLCGRWTCDPSNCPPASAAPFPAPAGSGMQCQVCGGWFGVAAVQPGEATAWICGACQNLGR